MGEWPMCPDLEEGQGIGTWCLAYCFCGCLNCFCLCLGCLDCFGCLDCCVRLYKSCKKCTQRKARPPPVPPADRCVVEGPGLADVAGFAGEGTHFAVACFKKGGGGLDDLSVSDLVVEVTGPATLVASISKTVTGARVTYTARKAGTYKVSVRYLAHPVPGSPFAVGILHGNIDGQRSSVQHPSGLVQGVMVAALGLEKRVKVVSRDACDNERSAGGLLRGFRISTELVAGEVGEDAMGDRVTKEDRAWRLARERPGVAGTLRKRVERFGVLPGWDACHFCLSGDALFYAGSPADAQPRGVLYLQGARARDLGQACFEVFVPLASSRAKGKGKQVNRVYTLKADSATAAAEWVAAVQGAQPLSDAAQLQERDGHAPGRGFDTGDIQQLRAQIAREAAGAAINQVTWENDATLDPPPPSVQEHEVEVHVSDEEPGPRAPGAAQGGLTSKQAQVQAAMRDTSLSPQERQAKMQAIMRQANAAAVAPDDDQGAGPGARGAARIVSHSESAAPHVPAQDAQAGGDVPAESDAAEWGGGGGVRGSPRLGDASDAEETEQGGDDFLDPACSMVVRDNRDGSYWLDFSFVARGVFKVTVSYRGAILKGGVFQAVVLKADAYSTLNARLAPRSEPSERAPPPAFAGAARAAPATTQDQERVTYPAMLLGDDETWTDVDVRFTARQMTIYESSGGVGVIDKLTGRVIEKLSGGVIQKLAGGVVEKLSGGVIEKLTVGVIGKLTGPRNFKTRIHGCPIRSNVRFSPVADGPKVGISDGSGTELILSTPERMLVQATFYLLLQARMAGAGGTFNERRATLFRQIKRTCPPPPGGHFIKVQRDRLVVEAFEDVGGKEDTVWKQTWTVRFDGEPGIDQGGLLREFFTVLGREMFSTTTLHDGAPLWVRMGTEAGPLLHPNFEASSETHLLWFGFCGKVVAKSLYDAAVKGSSHLLPVHLTRSFIKMILGVPISYHDFETDDPQLYTSKVKYITENEINDAGLDLFFVEEHFSNTGTLERATNLLPGGDNVPVTDSNKHRYLTLLARLRLGLAPQPHKPESASPQVGAFLEGFYSLVPEALLEALDENEVELLLCGLPDVPFADFKAHTTYPSNPIVLWFWQAVENLSMEDRARLLQFITGSSQVPAGGFSELRPRLNIQLNHRPATHLPVSHTCFNTLELPAYRSFEQVQERLALAIKEGAEGFGTS